MAGLPVREPAEEVPEVEDHSGTERLKALADGLFAVVMTLLVLDLKLPDQPGRVPDSNLLSLIFESDFLSKLILYAITFLIAGIYWYSHVQIMRRLKRIDEGMFWLNLAFFLFITFLPFTSNLFAQVGQGDKQVLGFNTILIYSGNNLIAGTLLLVIWFYASSGYRLISSEVKRYEIPLITSKIAIFPFIALVSIVSGWLINPEWGVVPYYILPAVLNTAQGIYDGRQRRRHGDG